jgi:hypothetical protein
MLQYTVQSLFLTLPVLDFNDKTMRSRHRLVSKHTATPNLSRYILYFEYKTLDLDTDIDILLHPQEVHRSYRLWKGIVVIVCGREL